MSGAMTSSSSSTPSWGSREELLLACAVRRYGPLMWQIIAAELSKRQMHDEGSNCNNNNSNSGCAFTPRECQCKYDELLMRFKRINCRGDGDCLTRMITELTRLRIHELKFLVRKQDLSIKKCELNLKKLQEEKKTVKPEVDSVGIKGNNRKRKGVNVASPAGKEKKMKNRSCKQLNKEEEKSNVDRKKRGKTDTDTDVIEKMQVRPEKKMKKTVIRVGASDDQRPKVIVCGLMAVASATARTPDSAKSRQVSRRSKAC